MGLDMYLSRKKEMSDDLTEVSYWRKANQIHKWFVDNVQNGVDECQRSDVTVDQLMTLYKLCRQALVDRNPELLPPSSGFFFGGTEIDAWYWEGLIDTCIYLAPLVWESSKTGDKPVYVYQSSW